MNLPNHDHIENAVNRIEKKVKHGKFKLKKKQLKYEVLKDFHQAVPDMEREKICREARKTAHSAKSDMLRDKSNDVADDLI